MSSKYHDPSQLPFQDITREESIRILLARTAVHELGHYFQIGNAEEGVCGNEIYSGGSDDPTNETITQAVWGTPINYWSAMSETDMDGAFLPPTGIMYTAFSIEELSTVSQNTTVIDQVPGNYTCG